MPPYIKANFRNIKITSFPKTIIFGNLKKKKKKSFVSHNKFHSKFLLSANVIFLISYL